MSVCLNCNKEVETINGKRPKIFCNSTCRSNYWQKENRKNKSQKSEAIKKKDPVLISSTTKTSCDSDKMPEGLDWKQQIQWLRNNKK